MTFTILTIYRLFFITQSDFLYALTKDGRVLKIKKVPYFSALSSDKKILSGISFDGENTHIFSAPFGFSEEKPALTTSFFGYFYYPALSANRKKVALIEADLLKPRPQGELCIYQKKIKRWYKLLALDAKIKAPIFLKDDSVLYINPENILVLQKQDGNSVPIASNVQNFNVSLDGKKLCTFNGEQIDVYNLDNLQKASSFPALYVSALAFDENSQEITYATSYENRHAIYTTKATKSELLVQTQEPVTLIDTNI